MLVLGVLALVFPVVASAWLTVMLALSFLVGGIVGWVNNLARARSLSRWHYFWRLVVSTCSWWRACGCCFSSRPALFLPLFSSRPWPRRWASCFWPKGW
jgi:hypothetical protein